MAPNIRLKGPKLAGNKVSFSTECHIRDGKQIRQLNVQIRLPSQVLGSLSYPFTNLNEANPTDTNKQTKTKLDEPMNPDEDSESDLSSLDWELNQALSSSNTLPSSETSYKVTNQPTQTLVKKEMIETNVTKQMKHMKGEEKTQGTDDKLAGYRMIPKNLISIIKRELGDIGDNDDDLGMIEKMVFTLKDPLSASKMHLPVKSCLCQHFECFDFENFCIFNKIPTGVKTLIKKDLAKRNLDLKKSEMKPKQFVRGSMKYERGVAPSVPINLIHFPTLHAPYNQKNYKQAFAQPNIPTYKCPVCNVTFALNQLYISDVFNFFVKTTPKHIDRIELIDMVRYKIIDDSKPQTSTSNFKTTSVPDEIVVLSDEETDLHLQTSRNHEPTQPDSPIYEPSDDVFDDGLDNELVRLSNLHELADDGYKGEGSWEDPVTLD